MTLAAGARLGPYSIVGPLGAGGMGEVYRAHDSRLGRDVAVKVLLQDRAVSDDARARFEREARTISQLSHPNICTLHDVGRDGETPYLVMELLEGETLADRLTRGSLPLAEVARVGIEICYALEAAHAKGVVHRDLKPGNVMLTKAGVKLLDFGLAKALETPGGGALREQLPTEGATPQTAEGHMLGTLPYMSPEQLEGRPADARTDIFALGAILFEAATGRRPFQGQSLASLVSAIMTYEPPPVSSLQSLSPPELDRLVKTCLSKDPAGRWASAHDVALLLRALPEAAPRALAPSRARIAWLPWLVAAAVCAVSAFLLARRSAPPSRPIRFQIPPPPGGAFGFTSETTFLALSPDGSDLVYVATDAAGKRRVYHRPLSAREASPLAGTEGAKTVFLSPDGRSVGFSLADRICRLELPGGSPVVICEIPPGGSVSASWSRNGDILFGGPQRDAIYRVSSAGGTPVAVVKLDEQGGGRRVMHPWFLPDGDRFLYVSWTTNTGGELMLVEPGRAARSLGPMQSLVQLSEPDVLVFVRDGALLGQRLDLSGRRLVGAPFPVAERVRYFQSTGGATFGVARNGTFAYQQQDDVTQLEWFDRAGRGLGPVGPVGNFLRVAIAPDGRRALVDSRRPDVGTLDIWMVDLALGTESHVTNDPATEVYPVWAPGGTIVYSVGGRHAPRLVRHDLGTGKIEQLLPDGAGFQIAQDVSPDGTTLVYTDRAGGTFDIYALPLSGGAPRPLVRSPFDEGDVRFSPDGRTLAFTSNETGREEAYVMPFPGPGEKRRVSTGGARCVRWSRDGRELFYLSADRRLMAAPIRTTPPLEIGAPAALFALTGKEWKGFDVAPDGKRFLAILPQVVGNEQPLEVVLNGLSAR